jgi:hypothetical protein
VEDPEPVSHYRLAILARMERLISDGNREQTLVTFFREIVMISPSEITRHLLCE